MRRVFGSVVLVVSVLAMSACGGSGPGEVTGDPTYEFNAKTAFLFTSGPAASPDLSVALVALADTEIKCADFKTSAEPAHYMLMTFTNLGKDVTTGDFNVDADGATPTGPSSLVGVRAGTNEFNGTSGKITLTAFGKDGAKGTFTAKDASSTLSGSFDAVGCDALNDAP